jgi:hypothetical protein
MKNPGLARWPVWLRRPAGLVARACGRGGALCGTAAVSHAPHAQRRGQPAGADGLSESMGVPVGAPAIYLGVSGLVNAPHVQICRALGNNVTCDAYGAHVVTRPTRSSYPGAPHENTDRLCESPPDMYLYVGSSGRLGICSKAR